jgi:hypothetical protein
VTSLLHPRLAHPSAFPSGLSFTLRTRFHDRSTSHESPIISLPRLSRAARGSSRGHKSPRPAFLSFQSLTNCPICNHFVFKLFQQWWWVCTPLHPGNREPRDRKHCPLCYSSTRPSLAAVPLRAVPGPRCSRITPPFTDWNHARSCPHAQVDAPTAIL